MINVFLLPSISRQRSEGTNGNEDQELQRRSWGRTDDVDASADN